MNQLKALQQYTRVVVDSGDFKQIRRLQAQDATTNPSLILKAAQQPDYQPLVQQISRASGHQPVEVLVDRLLVRFGCEILTMVPGRVSTEVDARLSFDSPATVARAQRLMALYRAEGIGPERVLIKVAATWEGIQAAHLLEQQGIHTNLTLLFSLCQAVACAQAQVRLISPFVGRVYDWHKKAAGAAWSEAERLGPRDPGVQLVTEIYNHYKKFGIPTEIMGASFRHLSQITALAGCDLLTISPDLIAALAAQTTPLQPVLRPEVAQALPMEALRYDQASFRLALNNNAMATEKLAEGIRVFCADTAQLEQLLLAA